MISDAGHSRERNPEAALNLPHGNWNTLTLLAAAITGVLGIVVLAGWMFSVPLLKSVLPGAVEMKANTAIGLILCACALYLFGNRSSQPQQRIAQALGVAVMALGLATMGEYLFGWRLGIDELLFRDTDIAYNIIRGRMSPYSAAAFAMIGLALTILPWRALGALAQLLSILVLAIGGISFLGYVWNAGELVTDRLLPPLAVNTAAAFALLGIGMIRASSASGHHHTGRSSVEIKILAGFVSAIVLLFIMGGYTYRAGAEYENSAQWVEHTREVLAELSKLYGTIAQVESSQRGYLLTGKQAFKVERQRFVTDLDEDKHNLAQLVSDNPAQLESLAKLKVLLAQRMDELNKHLVIFEYRGLSAARTEISREDGINQMRDISDLILRMDKAESQLLSARQATLKQERRFILVSLLATLLVAVALLTTLFLAIRREIMARAQARDQLRASEENLSVTLDSIGDAVMTTDAQGRVTRLNPVAEQLTGWAQAEAAGHPVDDVFHIINHQTRQPATIPVATTLAQGVIQGLANDTVLIARDGSERPIADSCAPIRNRDGIISGAVLVFRDVSNEYAAQAALHDSAMRIRTILDTVADGIITISEHGLIESFNPAAEQIFGYTAAETNGQSIGKLMPEPYRSEHENYIERYCLTGEAHIIGKEREVSGLHKDGRTFPLNLLVSEMWLGKQRHFTGIMRDISARKEAEDQLDLFFSLSLDMLCISSKDGYFKRISPAFTRTLGWSTEEILARPFLDFVHPDDTAATLREVERQVAAGERVLNFENRYRHKDGSWRILSWKSVPDASGLMFATARDVTAHKQAEQDLIVAKNQAEMANRAKDSFLATMSHEIRTPLTGMLGMLEVLSLTPLNHDQNETLQAAWESARNLLRIVNDILDWSKIEAGKLHLTPHATSIPQLLQEVINTYSRVASAKSLVLRQHIDTRISPAHIVDALRLSQVLNNFVSNAIKFTHSGEISLSATLLEKIDSGERIRFAVKDTGIGIARDAQQHLFRRFQQESVNTARMFGGTGLGLAICKSLVDLMDGQIELVSEPGEGSTFSITLTLPVSGVPGEALQTQNLTVEQRAVKPLFDGGADAPLVLAVDDHPINRDLLVRQIKLLGLRAETAENGAEALLMWREKAFALIISDCHMPEMDGYALSRAIRKTESEKGLPRTVIIAWTANALPKENEQCFASGMDDLLVKPANLAQLKKTLAKWLSIPESSDSAPAHPLRDIDDGRIKEPIDFDQLKQVVPDSAEHMQVLLDFQSSIRTDRTSLAEMLAQGDPAKVASAAHRMKGSSRMVGATYIAAACAAIEHAAQDGDLAGAAKAEFALEEAVRQFESFLAQARNPKVYK